MTVPPATVLVPSQDHLPRMSLQQRLSASDMGDNEAKPGTVYRSDIYLTTEENRENSARRPIFLDKKRYINDQN